MGTSNEWGRVADDGTVYITTPGGERAVGSWMAGTPEEGLAHFGRRYADLVTEVSVLEGRVRSGVGNAAALLATAQRLLDSLPEAKVLGDLGALADRLDAVAEKAAERAEQESAAKAAASAELAETKRALAEEAQRLAQTTSNWKAAGDRIREITTSWRELKGAPRKLDDELWAKVVAARTEFEKRRGTHFAQLGEARKVTIAAKEKIVAEAEALSSSEEWNTTANRLKALMGEWKAAGHAAKGAEDALWARFRAAQDAFFERRSAQHAQRDDEFSKNLRLKTELVELAEKLDVSGGLDVAQKALRDLQDRFHAVGKVPREAVAGLDRRMEAVGKKLAGAATTAAEARWHQVDVSTSPLVVRLRESVEKLERRVERARAAGDQTALAEHEASLATQKEWLDQAERG